jgi:hypothetical protein
MLSPWNWLNVCSGEFRRTDPTRLCRVKIRLYQQPSYTYFNIYQPARSLWSMIIKLFILSLTVPPVTKTKTASRAFQFATPTIWNSLPLAVRESSSLPDPAPLYQRHRWPWINGAVYINTAIDWLMELDLRTIGQIFMKMNPTDTEWVSVDMIAGYTNVQ